MTSNRVDNSIDREQFHSCCVICILVRIFERIFECNTSSYECREKVVEAGKDAMYLEILWYPNEKSRWWWIILVCRFESIQIRNPVRLTWPYAWNDTHTFARNIQISSFSRIIGLLRRWKTKLNVNRCYNIPSLHKFVKIILAKFAVLSHLFFIYYHIIIKKIIHVVVAYCWFSLSVFLIHTSDIKSKFW